VCGGKVIFSEYRFLSFISKYGPEKGMNLEKAALWLVIIVNILLFSYIMIYYPYRCNEIAILSGGAVSCGLNIGAYLLAIIISVVAAGAAILLIQE
jgi:hypothetical protein